MEFPLWLLFALISPAFWAIVHVLDSYCVEEMFDRPWMGVVCSGISMLVVLPFLLLGLILTPSGHLAAIDAALCLVCGVVFMASQAFYFKALSLSESGIVAAYWNLIPISLLLAGYFFLDEKLTFAQYGGAALIVMASIAFCLLDSNWKSRWASLGLMMLGAWLQVIYFLVQKAVFNRCPVYVAFLMITFFMAISGVAPLLLPRQRLEFQRNWPRIRGAFGFLVVIEALNLIAVGTSLYAVSYGLPSLVSAVEASIPAYVFSLSLGLYALTGKYGEEEASQRMPAKLGLVAMMGVGGWLVA